jgi:D-3-phosphoglycerate dehydrogenase
MKKILIIEEIHKSGIDLLKKRDDFSFEFVENIEKKFLKKKLKEFDAITLKTFKFDSELIESANNLKIISRHGVGYDNVDLKTIKKKNITLAITSKANAASVAEHVFFMMLNLSKGSNMYDKLVKEGNFTRKHSLNLTKELWQKKILIVGFGRVGTNLIKKCKGFEMNVCVYDPYVDKKIIEQSGGKKIENLKDAINDMDYVSIHSPQTKETKNMFNLEMFKKMKKSSIIINTSRGGVINEAELNEALNKNLIFGAGLDVFEKEPPGKNNLLLKNEKVFLSPHSATFTEECIERMGMEVVQNIIDFFDGKLEKSKIIKV